jgi:predicted transcriptional regulator
MYAATFTIPPMPKRTGPDADKREVVTIRLPGSIVAKLKTIGEQAEFPATLTQIIERAVREFIDKREKKPK